MKSLNILLLIGLSWLQISSSHAAIHKTHKTKAQKTRSTQVNLADKLKAPIKNILANAAPKPIWSESYESFQKMKDSKARELEAERIAILFYDENNIPGLSSNLQASSDSKQIVKVVDYLLEKVKLKTKDAVSNPLLNQNDSSGEFARDSARHSLENIRNEYVFLDLLIDLLRAKKIVARNHASVKNTLHSAMNKIVKAETHANSIQEIFQEDEFSEDPTSIVDTE